MRPLLSVTFWLYLSLLAGGALAEPAAPLPTPAAIEPAPVKTTGAAEEALFTLDFAAAAEAVDPRQWLQEHGFELRNAAKEPHRLALALRDGALVLAAQSRLRGFLIHDEIALPEATRVRIEWGVLNYPKNASYANGVRNEALMLYLFFGDESHPSGHLLLPPSPYYIGLYLNPVDPLLKPYTGNYYQKTGRFVCVGNPESGVNVVTEFDLKEAFSRFFGQPMPAVRGFGFSVDTSESGDHGRAAAYVRRIEFLR